MIVKAILSTTAILLWLSGVMTLAQPEDFVGGVYTMTNDPEGNAVLAYGRRANGTIEFLGQIATGGAETGIVGSGFPFFDTGDGLDPLQSTYAVQLSEDRQFLFVLNGGSASISSFVIGADFVPVLTDVTPVRGFGPSSIAQRGDMIYVSSIDADGMFAGSLGEVGLIEAFRLTAFGRLVPISNSLRLLTNRPAGLDVSLDGNFLIVTSLNAGSAGTPASPSFVDDDNSVVVFGLDDNGLPSLAPLSAGISISPADQPDRAITLALGLETIAQDGRQFAVVTEARSVALPDGTPVPTLTPGFPGPGVIPLFQPGGVSSWEILPSGELVLIDAVPVNDVVSETTVLGSGQSATCWIQFSNDGSLFWVVNTIDSSISAFRFEAGEIALIEEVVAQGNGLGDAPPDMVTPPDAADGMAIPRPSLLFGFADKVTTEGLGPEAAAGPGVEADSFGGAPNTLLGGTDGFLDFRISDDGRFLYQTLGLARGILVYRIDEPGPDGAGGGLTLIQEVLTPELPAFNIQGIDAF